MIYFFSKKYFISTRARDLVSSILSRRVTALDRLGELFSTHPNIVKKTQSPEQLKESPETSLLLLMRLLVVLQPLLGLEGLAAGSASVLPLGKWQGHTSVR